MGNITDLNEFKKSKKKLTPEFRVISRIDVLQRGEEELGYRFVSGIKNEKLLKLIMLEVVENVMQDILMYNNDPEMVHDIRQRLKTEVLEVMELEN